MEGTMPKAGLEWTRRQAPEIVLAALATVVFLGCLGSVDLWGKREQRASAEAIDTIDHGHWLVAQIQGRPRLEKPPLPRWVIAGLITVTGRRDEVIVRLPSALSALGMVWLVYAFGRRIGGRSIGLAAGLTLCSTVFFVSELRQAGNDGPLALFTTLAIYAAWRRLHGAPEGVEAGRSRAAEPLGEDKWCLAFCASLGLGFLTKGPVIFLLVAWAIIPYLAISRRLKAGLRGLFNARGLLVLATLALSWPVPVLLGDPNAVRVWYLEMAQKAGLAGQLPHHHRETLLSNWPGLVAPWTVITLLAIALPFLQRGRAYRPSIWLPWGWTVGNLAMFSVFAVAKPSYYLPCIPGAALLTGIEWIRITNVAHAAGRASGGARRVLQFHWVALFVFAGIAPVVVREKAPEFLLAAGVISVCLIVAVVASVNAWRRGQSAGVLAPFVAASAVAVVVVYGFVAPAVIGPSSHRGLASQLGRVLPREARTVMFFHELDEGLWFYLRDRELIPVPGSQPKYNDFIDIEDEAQRDRRFLDPDFRTQVEKEVLLKWLRKPHPESEYVLIRTKHYDLFARDLAGLATPIHREYGLKRNEVTLLHAPSPPPIAGANHQGAVRR
jgi:4-amino-4-deoxy-L-arabinose transferase-like glycosyltransferase